MKEMKKHNGFTLIELIIFIIITSLLASTVLLTFTTMLNKVPTMHYAITAVQTAKQCMEWFIGQRRMNGYSSLTCGSAPSPSLCSAPTGYTIANSITCPAINGDSSYLTITVTVSGLGDAVFTTLVADY